MPDLASALAADLRGILSKLRRRYREHGSNHDLKPSQVSVLLHIESEGPATISALARVEGVRPQSMSAVVTTLLEAGLLQGAPDPADGRQTLMSLTPKCLKWIREGRAAKQDWLTNTISQRLSAREQERLRSCLELLSKIVEE